MNEKIEFIVCENDHKDIILSIFSSLFKLKDLEEVLIQVLRQSNTQLNATLTQKAMATIPGSIHSSLLCQGQPVEILSLNDGGWQKGSLKIRICFEFHSQLSQSNESLETNISSNDVLDEIRQSISN